MRNCDNFHVTRSDVDIILAWDKLKGAADGPATNGEVTTVTNGHHQEEVATSNGVDAVASSDADAEYEIAFKPARVILQDFTGVPAVVDFAAMRDAVGRLGGDPSQINPSCPCDLVIDHSVQVDFAGNAEAIGKNQDMEYERNRERFTFLKWGATAFDNMLIVPPGSGIVHQVNLEYLARVVFDTPGASADRPRMLYPDTVVGTDSHTTMINGLGVVGWGVGGIEAEAVMLGQSISMLLPEVVGYRLVGKLSLLATSTDLVLTITKNLRQVGVVGKFVEFFGPGVADLSIADRATISNMCPEYGATIGYFPVDVNSLSYLRQTSEFQRCNRIEIEYGTDWFVSRRPIGGAYPFDRAVSEGHQAATRLFG